MKSINTKMQFINKGLFQTSDLEFRYSGNSVYIILSKYKNSRTSNKGLISCATKITFTYNNQIK